MPPALELFIVAMEITLSQWSTGCQWMEQEDDWKVKARPVLALLGTENERCGLFFMYERY